MGKIKRENFSEERAKSPIPSVSSKDAKDSKLETSSQTSEDDKPKTFFKDEVTENFYKNLESNKFCAYCASRKRVDCVSHNVEACPKLAKAECPKCHQKGHTAAYCSAKRCWHCRQWGHVAADCDDLVCSRCGKQGHHYDECTIKVCEECNKAGHIAINCPRVVCTECENTGHIGRNCPFMKHSYSAKTYTISFNVEGMKQLKLK